jgi:hypothetical protein
VLRKKLTVLPPGCCILMGVASMRRRKKDRSPVAARLLRPCNARRHICDTHTLFAATQTLQTRRRQDRR